MNQQKIMQRVEGLLFLAGRLESRRARARAEEDQLDAMLPAFVDKAFTGQLQMTDFNQGIM